MRSSSGRRSTSWKTTQSKEKEQFNSKIFSKAEKELFTDAIRPITQKLFNKQKYVVQLIADFNLSNGKTQLPNISELVQKQVLSNPPCLVLI